MKSINDALWLKLGSMTFNNIHFEAWGQFESPEQYKALTRNFYHPIYDQLNLLRDSDFATKGIHEP